MTKNRVPGAELRPLLETVDQDAAAVDSEDDDDDDSSDDKGALQSDICYFLIGGNDGGLFDVNPASHELTVLRSLDREETAVHHLVVWATEDCASQQQPPSLSLKDDSPVLHIVVTVLDVNDNPPEFTQSLFTGGVSTDVAFGTEFMRVAATSVKVQRRLKFISSNWRIFIINYFADFSTNCTRINMKRYGDLLCP